MSVRWMLAALLAVPGVASAGVGISYSPPMLSQHVLTGAGGGDTFGLGALVGGSLANAAYLPTLDYRMSSADFQFHVLDLLAIAAASDFNDFVLGANGYYHLVQNPLPGKGKIVFDPGVQLELGTAGGDALIQVLVAGRAGVEVGEGKGGLGVYAIPDLGVGLYGDDSTAIFGGSMGFSVWY